MSLSFLCGRSATLSPELHAEAFGGTVGEAVSDLSALLSGGAIPLTLSREGEVLSQGIGIPLWADTALPVLYLYALTTAPSARGQGLMRTLLREVAEPFRRSAYTALCLLPADDALAAAYRRMGFSHHRPAGGAAVLRSADDFSFCFPALPDFEPCSFEEARVPLGMTLSRELFAYTAASLGEGVTAARTRMPYGYEYALLFRDDPHYALAVTDGLSARVTRQGTHELLLTPLGTTLPGSVPEPLPR